LKLNYLTDLIEQYGLLFVFLNVFVEQLGAPVPAYPTLIITSALSTVQNHPAFVLLTAVVASLIADFAWYAAGKRYGRKIMFTICRISLSPDSCVSQTEALYMRWGAPSLIVAKFIPGFASIASALAGATGTRRLTFLLFDGIGAAIWAGLAIFLGSLFSTAVDDLLAVLENLGKWGALLIGFALALFVARKWWERKNFIKSIQMERISVGELDQLLKRSQTPIIVDVRSPLAQQAGRIPGAVPMSDADINTFVLDMPSESEVIVYCSCPNEVSAARIAKLLKERGYSRVRPLAGGIDAWISAGHSVEKV
jgi:membrane protein DedA with SNARE-associated domain/rhodanese-related sulfurtransferase